MATAAHDTQHTHAHTHARVIYNIIIMFNCGESDRHFYTSYPFVYYYIILYEYTVLYTYTLLPIRYVLYTCTKIILTLWVQNVCRFFSCHITIMYKHILYIYLIRVCLCVCLCVCVCVYIIHIIHTEDLAINYVAQYIG